MSSRKASRKKNDRSSKKKAKQASANGSALKGPVIGQISPAASAYARVLRNPFDAPVCGVPTFPPIPSAKYRVWAKGSACTGTAGYGCVMVNPYKMCFSDTAGVYYSSDPSTYAETKMITSSSTTGSSTASSNAPYTSGDLGVASDKLQFRVVACGLKLWFSGTELDLSGVNIMLVHPDNISLAAFTAPQLLAFPECVQQSFTSRREPITMSWLPTRPVDTEFQDYTQFLAGESSSVGVLISGAVSKQSWVTFEAYAIAEYVGAIAPNRTMTYADPEGLNAVLTSAESQGSTSTGAPAAAAKGLVERAKDYLAIQSGPIAETVGKFAGAAFAAYNGGYPRVPFSYPDERGPRVTVEETTDKPKLVWGQDEHFDLFPDKSKQKSSPDKTKRATASAEVVETTNEPIPHPSDEDLDAIEVKIRQLTEEALKRPKASDAELLNWIRTKMAKK